MTPAATTAASLDGLARCADRVRRKALLALGPLARRLIVPRERRVAVFGVIGVATALALTWCSPLALLALGPIALGIPHLLADARYLVVRPGLHRRPAAMIAAGLLVMGLVLGFGVRAGLASAAFAALASRGAWWRRGLVASAALALAALAHTSPFAANVVFFHAHNLVAVAVWLAWRRRATIAHYGVVAALALGSVLVLAGPPRAVADAAHWTGLSIAELGQTLSLSSDPATTTRWVLFFAFAQSVHYLLWLRLIPDDARRSGTPRSYSQSVRALRKDIGGAGVAVAVASSAAILALAMARLSFARDVYLGVAYAHGHLELVAAAFLVSEAKTA